MACSARAGFTPNHDAPYAHYRSLPPRGEGMPSGGGPARARLMETHLADFIRDTPNLLRVAAAIPALRTAPFDQRRPG